ncbi:hypothetical protein NDU88_001036 [Pleurodeles waltl]|uniref:Uncharacterized protein n=1 Tax=Pleurodeles waltl TaxID=8319 RepID=A0AAV7NIY3_PLEWA|nr:hypothetical protein NDU88_001036 [Pleurodeles waltl]
MWGALESLNARLLPLREALPAGVIYPTFFQFQKWHRDTFVPHLQLRSPAEHNHTCGVAVRAPGDLWSGCSVWKSWPACAGTITAGDPAASVLLALAAYRVQSAPPWETSEARRAREDMVGPRGEERGGTGCRAYRLQDWRVAARSYC